MSFLKMVSIHAPYIGSDEEFDNNGDDIIASIHAPYIGSDDHEP